MKYIVAIIEQNSWHMDGTPIVKMSCEHKHRTLTGADRCKADLSEYYPDGMHNEWAHFGQILHEDGTYLTPEEIATVWDLEFQRSWQNIPGRCAPKG